TAAFCGRVLIIVNANINKYKRGKLNSAKQNATQFLAVFLRCRFPLLCWGLSRFRAPSRSDGRQQKWD
ncbi:MAG: hypothetical protein ACWGMZ_10200, partial [Thermoguttaceae bacterium]